MAQDERNAQLLRNISVALGVNTKVFSEDQSTVQGVPDDYHTAVLLIRLVRAFHALPNDDKRLELLRLVESCAAEANPDHGMERP
ncbi:hypothetical protein MKK75_29825 [Methylobacterium sp. J-030]|uniref:hypothetical protein n=1 Tax=Methylobacterium sp. J-030 TaxID=2836627 RepID=UPI001FBAA064|nr:hypothetical protein [Methylobacterium sp. J-030]MCJ2072944.1 hypothetical protein [Methylobacterium sp. J-030]